MALYKPNCKSNDCKWRYTSQIANLLIANCQVSKPHPPVAMRSIGMKDALYFWFLPCWLGSPILHTNAAVTAWFTSLRTFGNICTWLGVGRFTLTWNINEYSSQQSIVECDCTVLCKWEHVLSISAKGVRSRVILIIAYSFSCNLLVARCWKTNNSQSKESCNQNPSYGIVVYLTDVTNIYTHPCRCGLGGKLHTACRGFTVPVGSELTFG